MSSQWYFQVGNEQFGPLSSSDLKQLCRENRLLPDNLVRQGEEGRWVKASQVQGLFPSPASVMKAAPLGPRVSDSSLGDQIAPQVRAVAPNPAAAKPPPPRGAVAPAPQHAPPAPQFAAPPPPRGTPAVVAPAAVPMGGIPMGMPVASVPMGAPVAASPVAAAQAFVAPVAVAVSPGSRAPADDDDETPGKKKDNTALFVTVGLAACVLLLAGVGAAIGMGMFTPKPVEKKQIASGAPKTANPGTVEVDPESLPLAAADELAKDVTKEAAKQTTASKGNAQTKGKPVAKAVPEIPGKPTAIQDKSIRVVRQWVNVATMTKLTSGNLQLKILGSWFGGEGNSAKADGAAADEEAAANPKSDKADRRHIYVEVLVTNAKGPGPVNYKSWNGAGKKPEETAAILLDDQGRVCALVGRERAPDAGRQQTAELEMGETTTDVLVFEVPQGDFDFVKLVLPQTAVGRDGAWGFQISRDWVAPDKMAAKSAGTPTVASGAPRPAPGNAGGAPLTTGDDPPLTAEKTRPSETPSVKRPVDPDAPPSIKDIVERDLKSMKQKEAERKEAERKAAEEKAGNKPAP